MTILSDSPEVNAIYLSGYEQRIVSFIREKGNYCPVEDISAETLIPIDIVVTACVWLAQNKIIKMERRADPSELYIYLSD